MKSVWLFAIGILVAQSAQAQWAAETLGQPLRPLPAPPTISTDFSPLAKKPTVQANQNAKADAQKIARALNEAFVMQLTDLKQDPPACGQSARAGYLLALQTSGQYEGCLSEVRRCQNQADFREELIGASCAVAIFDHQSAQELFTRATQSRWSKEVDFPYAVFQFASYQYTSPRPELTKERLALNSAWTNEDRRLLEAMIEDFSRGRTSLATDKEIDQYLQKQDVASPQLRELFSVFWVTLPTLEYKWPEALARLKTSYSLWRNPLNWYELAFDLFYSQGVNDFGLARYIYEAYIPFAHSRSRLPLEQNIYTYSEIKSKVCAKTVLQGDQAKQFSQAKAQWREGQKSTRDLKQMAEQFAQSQPTADVMAVLGSLELAQGHLQEARNLYWQGHQLCPYYNRSHWGLNLIRRQEKYNSYPDRATLEEKKRQELNARPPVAALGRYILNWANLNDGARLAVAYESRTWRDYIGALEQADRYAYIKSVFELLSETPGMSQLRDVRISYDGDNRLWDDVRGAGGKIVIADLGEVQQTVLGAYNLLGHEMTHQFHDYVRKTAPEVRRCITHLYEAAKSRDRFPDGYARTNEDEYLAQGVTYDMIGEDAHTRFGLNRSWIEKNDPDLFKIIQSIKSSQGNLTAIACPI